MTPSERKALRERFSGLELEEALTALRRFCADKSNALGCRSCATLAIIDLKNGEAVESVLAMFRQEIGLDRPPRRRAVRKAGGKVATPRAKAA